VTHDNLLTDRQPHARAWVSRVALESPEKAEQLPAGLRVNADAVVAHGKTLAIRCSLSPHPYLQWRIVAKFKGIVEQFLKDQLELTCVGLKRR
jgi:hypothetical protein